jgi:asparagine synthase (glutamine-hydrolysing)
MLTIPLQAFTAPPAVGPKMRQLLTDLVNAETVDELGFLEWSLVKHHLSNAFGYTSDIKSLRYIFTVAQWVILSQRFGIAKAEPTPPKQSVVSCNTSKSFSDGTIVTCQIVEV